MTLEHTTKKLHFLQRDYLLTHVTEALLIILRNLRQPICPFTKWDNSAVKKHEIMEFSDNWMELRTIILR